MKYKLLLALISFVFLGHLFTDTTFALEPCTGNPQCNDPTKRPDLEGCSFNGRGYVCKYSPTTVTPTPASSSEDFNVYCGGSPENGIRTAIGCIRTELDQNFIAQMMNLAIGLGGGLALLMMLYGVFVMTTSAGVPDKIKLAQEIISSAVMGLIFIALSLVFYNLIALNLLGLPGLS